MPYYIRVLTALEIKHYFLAKALLSAEDGRWLNIIRNTTISTLEGTRVQPALRL